LLETYLYLHTLFGGKNEAPGHPQAIPGDPSKTTLDKHGTRTGSATRTGRASADFDAGQVKHRKS
jgi:hypothetical protein